MISWRICPRGDMRSEWQNDPSGLRGTEAYLPLIEAPRTLGGVPTAVK